MNNQLAMHCYISGKVQGVWYRASAKTEADKMGLMGWAKNLEDGRVEVLVYGDEEKLQAFYEWLKQGPSLAKVEDVVRVEVLWQKYEGFDVL